MPNEKVLDLLDLRGDETVVDCGAGSGTLTVLGIAAVLRIRRCTLGCSSRSEISTVNLWISNGKKGTHWLWFVDSWTSVRGLSRLFRQFLEDIFSET